MHKGNKNIQNRALLFCFIGLAFLAFVSYASGQEETGQPAMAASYVGAETCAECHEDMVTSLKGTMHGTKAFDKFSAQGCEACHGPGSAHVEGGGDITMIKRIGEMKASEASESCLQCHEKGNQMYWKGGVHEQRELGCVSCHSVHNPVSDKGQLKMTSVNDQCGSCHLQVKSQIMRTSHHPIREGLMSCVSCHNPHGTQTPKMITTNSVNEQCYTCHAEKRGPFLWDHPPVRENCVTCHTPHGSSHPKLLVQKRPWLCQSCHLDTRHPGTLYDGTTLQTSSRELARACSNCHLTIHGSNHPSGWTFLR